MDKIFKLLQNKFMGKCKKRTLTKSDSGYFMTRESAVNEIFNLIINTKKKKNASNYKDAVKMISLFGITAEELSEAGVPYENLKALGTNIS